MGRAGEFQGILPNERNIHALFRKGFSLEGAPTKATLQISVDSRYKLYVNGTYIGRGIARCENCAWYFDEHDVTGVLKPGENIIAVKAVYFGEDLAWYQCLDSVKGGNLAGAAKGGLVFELDVELAGGKHVVIASDCTTKAIKLDAYRQDAPKKNGTLGRVDIVDLNLFPDGWTGAGFDDSTWASPLELNDPFEFVVQRNIPFLREVEVNPVSIMAYGEVEDAGADLLGDEDADDIPDFCIKNNIEINEPLGKATITGMDAITAPAPGKSCDVTSPGEGRAVFMLLDFGKNVTGYMHLVVEGEKGAVIDMIPSEQVAGNQVYNGDSFAGKRGMSVTLRDGVQEFEQTLWDGFKAVMVKIRNVKHAIKIHRLNAVFTSYPYEAKGSFECSSEMLNELWKACAYTLVLCTHDGYEDCPWREQRSYPGDVYVENLVNYAAFGDYLMGKKFIYDGAFDQLPTGMTFSFFCGDAYFEQHIIPNYQLYWIFVVDAHYLYSGDDGPIRDLYSSLLKAIEWWDKYLDRDTGLVKDVPFWKFIDWNDRLDADAEVNAVVNAQYYKALQLVAKYSRMLGWAEKASELSRVAERVRAGINKHLWDEGRGCYHDGLNGGDLDDIISQQTNALLIDFNIAPQDRWPRMLEVAFDGPAKGKYAIPWPKRGKGSKPQPGEVLLPQPFFMHFVNSALVKVGRFDLVFKMFEEGWGRMLAHPDYAGTIWETWEQHGSRTHAWSATPAYDLLTHVLGIKPTQPGFASFTIQPELHDLAWARGTFPSAKGGIGVRAETGGNTLAYTIEIPAALGKRGAFISPRLGASRVKRLEVGGKEMDVASHLDGLGRVVVEGLPAGETAIRIELA
ncbi:MAG: alpha-L-rhamnosidase N-terminal domain-containing protein [Candidatus Lokiarchaeota archaeon]|nr:alpha-L-rhamnosidase N-terminal domain-containing protein [Candidatus Lokiarchaeota archaeon]